ncbi:DUF1016 family protein [Dorea longicatena]|nr:DUF1016 family protein [Dorea longicatena]
MSNCKTISVCNQKGGVGKTTTTVNLGVGLAMQGKKVLLIDADPQGDLTTCLGWQDTDGLGITLATKLTDVINETMTDPMVGILHHEEGVDLVPANLELSAMEFNLVNAMSRETTLKNYLSQVKNRYDYVIIDCMPSLGMVTLNALSAADSVIIPVQAQYLPAKGMTQLVQTISKVKKYINPDIKIDGMLLTLVAKCRASVSVNSEIMKTNIFIGNVIIRNSEWGNKFVENLSKDMKMRFPSAKGYSVRNLKYMKKFAQTFTEDDVDEYGLGRITWSHHQILMSKVSNREEYIWYLEKTLEHKWSVDDLTSQVKSQLYERQAVANKISNFERRLPAEQKDMVLSTMKDPYMFDFIDYTEEMLETDIENELVKNVTSLLMELGTGFAFMGQQYHLEVGGKDFYIDLLFYNTKLRCYVAIDLKTGEFKPEQAGKMNFYLSALDDLVKAPEDNPSVGLILCRDENRTIAEYALRDMSKPIGVSEYHLCTDLPLDLKDALPAVEDIRSRIDMKK